MERHLVRTSDGSHSLYVPSLDEHYHSRHGAIQESTHVFIERALRPIARLRQTIHVLEYGFGTGLNALLTAIEAQRTGLQVHYVGLEAFPILESEWALLNYGDLLDQFVGREILERIHAATWGEWAAMLPGFQIMKVRCDMREFIRADWAHVVYFDAFAPEKQPELWGPSVFDQVFHNMAPGAVLSTYCAKGVVRRTMISAGFRVEKQPGPPGKREMLVGHKEGTL